MAVGILGVLTLTGGTLVYYSSTNLRSAEFSTGNASAYDLAEAGINEMMAVLSKPQNNALNKYLLGYQTDGSVVKTAHETTMEPSRGGGRSTSPPPLGRSTRSARSRTRLAQSAPSRARSRRRSP
jgi:hypothetical protein